MRQTTPVRTKEEELNRRRAATQDVLEEEFCHLHAPAGTGSIPLQSTSLEARERELRSRIHGLENKRAALCLSGGGIRSACFGLGVIQALAEQGRLGNFHYLSTVSGGGYIGSWLTAWIRRAGQGDVLQALAQPTAGPDSEPRPIRNLRAYSNYLSPVWGMSGDLFALIVVYLRNLVLNWFILIPLVLLVVLLPWLWMIALGFDASCHPYGILAAIVMSMVLMLMSLGYTIADLPLSNKPRLNNPAPDVPALSVDRYGRCGFLPLFASAFPLAWAGQSLIQGGQIQGWGWLLLVFPLGLLGCILTGRHKRAERFAAGPPSAGLSGLVLVTLLIGIVLMAVTLAAIVIALHQSRPLSSDERRLYAVLSVPTFLGAFWLATTLCVGLTRRWMLEEDREWTARAGGWSLRGGLIWLLLSVLVCYMPHWLFYAMASFPHVSPVSVGFGSGVLGIVISAAGYWSKNSAALKHHVDSLLALTGLRILDMAGALFIIALGVSASLGIAWAAIKAQPDLSHQVENVRKEGHAVPAAAASSGQPTELALTSKMNQIEGRVYVLALENAEAGTGLIAAAGLGFLVLALPYFFGVNAFSLHSMYSNRLVRAYLGASREDRNPHWFTGFDPADNIKTAPGLGKRPPAQLFHVLNMAVNLTNRAMSRLDWQQRKAASFIVTPLQSGSSRLGYVPSANYADSDGEGISLGRALAISGAAASPNMGYHTSPIVAFVMTFFNVRLGWWMPNPSSGSAQSRDEPRSGLGPLVREILGVASDDRPDVYVSDGGHFENLGIYEMVRRRCHIIVVVDAAHDPTYEYADLEDAIRKIRVDFGIPIEFPRGPNRLPHPPSLAGGDGRRIAVGTIGYSAVDGKNTDGKLIYIKPVLGGDEPLDVLRYAVATAKPNNVFPQQSTSDQFFDEAQFESYRALGRHTILTSFADGQGWPAMSVPLPFRASAILPNLGPASTPVPGGLATANNAGLASGAAGLARSAGQSAVLATAITVGGVVGVSGTLALAPNSTVTLSEKDRSLIERAIEKSSAASEVSLSASAVARLDQGITIKPPDVSFRVDPSQLQLHVDVDKEAAAKAAEEVLRAAQALATTNAAASRLVGTAGELSNRLAQLLASTPASGASGTVSLQEIRVRPVELSASAATSMAILSNRLVDIADQLKRLNLNIRPDSPASDSELPAVSAQLKTIQDSLSQILTSINLANPRKNISGRPDGGGR